MRRGASFQRSRRQIFDGFFGDFSPRPFKIAQKTLNPREDAMRYVLLGIVDLKPVATGISFRAPKKAFP